MKTAIIGVGSMGGAVADGLVASGFPTEDLILCNRHTAKLDRYKDTGVTVTDNCVEAARMADIIVVAVERDTVAGICDQIAAEVSGKKVISLAAGVPGRDLQRCLSASGSGPDVIAIAIPNIAASQCKSATFVSFIGCEPDFETVALFERVGSVRVVDEAVLGRYVALASCGIAFAMRYIRAATEGGVELGVRAADAQQIVAETVAGAAALLSQPGKHAEAEIDRVTTAGGITIRGLNAMEAAGFTPAVIAALRACGLR